MKYFVTYCTQDQDAGANPLYHSCFILSKTDESNKKLEVVENWGFYGLPTTTDRTTLMNRLKLIIGLDVDLYGNHGMLRHEDIRDLDLGKGLHGVTFELTQEQFETLQKNCATMVAEQDAAIKEVVETQGILPSEHFRIYPYEQYSPLIFALEKIKAKQKGIEPRLKPFELNLSFGVTGPSLETSKDCKSQALALLATVLTKKQIGRLTENGKHPTVPRYSGKMENILFHSSGPLKQHVKASGEVVYYRDGNDPEVKLHWTLPPQEIEALSKDTLERFRLENADQVKKVVKKLQSLEWLFRNAVVPAPLNQYKEVLISEIINCYKGFFSIEPKMTYTHNNFWSRYALCLFDLPNKEEGRVQGLINKVKQLFNALYIAIVDHWELIEGAPMESRDHKSSHQHLEEQFETNPIEVVASYLSTEDKQKLCKIIGRTYLPTLDKLAEEIDGSSCFSIN